MFWKHSNLFNDAKTVQDEKLQWNLSFGTSLVMEHLHSGDAKFGSGKMLK